MRDLRIVFMGTPEFAVSSLNILVENQFNVVAVITAVDKPKGRGRKLASSPVKIYSESRGIPVLQPPNLKNPEFLKELASYKANLQVVVAFRMLPEVVFAMPDFGTFNLHASLLPAYRGAAPINWAIINGEKKTGVTTFFLDKEIDTGNIILQDEEAIQPDDDAGSLYERLMVRGADLVLETVKAIAENNYVLKVQEITEGAPVAPKLFKETCEINWQQPAVKIYNFVRGLSPYPSAWTIINDKSCKIYRTSVIRDKKETRKPGDFWLEENKHLFFQTTDGIIEILELQIEGKKRMNTEDFLRGNTL